MSGESHISLRLALLDAQVVDRDRLPIGRVDDVELTVPAGGGAPEVSRLLVGSQALGERLGGVFGRWMSASSRSLRRSDTNQLPGFAPSEIDEILPLVKIKPSFEELEELGGLEHWLRSNFVDRLPGTDDASE